MFFWSRFPFVRAVVFFIFGIVLCINAPTLHYGVIIGLTISLIGLLGLILLRRKYLISVNPVYGAVITLIFMFLGYLFVDQSTKTKRVDHLIDHKTGSYYTAKVISEPLVKGNYLRMKMEILYVKDSIWQETSGNVLAYLKLPIVKELKFGDELLIKGGPTPVSPPLNPKEFNYKKYLSTKQIYHQDFVEARDWSFIRSHGRFSIRKASIAIRNYLEQKLAFFIPGAEELTIAKALILGNKNDLDRKTKEVYALSGAMHILAVSGLHVGVIYIVLLWLLGQRNGKLTRPRLVALIVIPLLWLYAFITGLSPSVVRAVIMFSFLLLAQVLNRRSNSLNILALSALLILLVDPFMILSVGFQLSYLAVGGIIFLFPWIERWYYPSNRIFRFFWQLTALSLAAQLATAPLSAYYFHRFPTYFLFSNLFVIPVAILIVWGGLFLLVMGSISSSIGIITGKLLSVVIFTLNSIIKFIATMPFADIHNLAPSLLTTWYIYGLLVLAGLYLLTRRRVYFLLTTGIILLIGINVFKSSSRDYKLRQVVFYSVGKSWAVDFVENREYVSLRADGSSLTENSIAYSIQPYRQFHRLEESTGQLQVKVIDKIGEALVWNGVKILLAEPCLDQDYLSLDFDYILFKVGQSGQDCYQDQIVMRKLVDHNKTSYNRYSLREQGALVVDI